MVVKRGQKATVERKMVGWAGKLAAGRGGTMAAAGGGKVAGWVSWLDWTCKTP